MWHVQVKLFFAYSPNYLHKLISVLCASTPPIPIAPNLVRLSDWMHSRRRQQFDEQRRGSSDRRCKAYVVRRDGLMDRVGLVEEPMRRPRRASPMLLRMRPWERVVGHWPRRRGQASKA